MTEKPKSAAPPTDDSSVHTTAVLLDRMKSGDKRAVEALFRRLIPVLRGMARGRVPQRVRGLKETDDLVMLVAERTWKHIERFHSQRKGCLVAYARRIMTNEIRDEYRRLGRTPETLELAEEIPAEHVDPLQDAIDAEVLAAYRTALEQLTEDEQDLILLSLEQGLSHAEVAQAMGRPTPDAARMAIARALARLAERMDWPEEDR